MREQRAPLACSTVRGLCRPAQLCRLGGTVPANKHSRHQESDSMRGGCNCACPALAGSAHAPLGALAACCAMLAAAAAHAASSWRSACPHGWLACAMSVRPAAVRKP